METGTDTNGGVTAERNRDAPASHCLLIYKNGAHPTVISCHDSAEEALRGALEIYPDLPSLREGVPDKASSRDLVYFVSDGQGSNVAIFDTDSSYEYIMLDYSVAGLITELSRIRPSDWLETYENLRCDMPHVPGSEICLKYRRCEIYESEVDVYVDGRLRAASYIQDQLVGPIALK